VGEMGRGGGRTGPVLCPRSSSSFILNTSMRKSALSLDLNTFVILSLQ